MATPRYRAGDVVRTLTANPLGHTRMPTYVRGRLGRIESVRRAHPLPDETVRTARKGEPVPVYGVAFTMEELWGPDAEPGSELVMELWESYLRPADGSE
jgi:nitrile hydratase subunit beta